MPVVLGGIFGLRLRAQHHLVDELFHVAALHPRENTVELLGPQRAGLGQRDVEALQELAQRVHALGIGLVVHAIDQRHARALQRLRGRHIGEDHEFLDQPVRVEALRRHHAIDGIVGGENDLAFGKVEIERRARVAGALDRAIGAVERLENGRQQRPAGLIGPTVDRGLRLRIVESRRRAHEHAMEAVGALAAVGADDQAHRQRGAILAGPERA